MRKDKTVLEMEGIKRRVVDASHIYTLTATPLTLHAMRIAYLPWHDDHQKKQQTEPQSQK